MREKTITPFSPPNRLSAFWGWALLACVVLGLGGGCRASGGKGDGGGFFGGGDGGVDADADSNEDSGSVLDFDTCDGISLTTDGVLDLDLQAAAVSGTVTLNGQAWPGSHGEVGFLLFRSTLGESVVRVPLRNTGSVRYETSLPPATYDVSFEPGVQHCDDLADPSWPCLGGLLQSELRLESDGVLDFDVRTAQVTGVVTLLGEPLPAEVAHRGSIQFVSSSTDHAAAVVDLGTSGSVSYDVVVLAGHYDVVFQGNPELCGHGPVPRMPCNSGMYEKDVPFVASGVFDVDLRAIEVTGEVTLNGSPLPSLSTDRGVVQLISQDAAFDLVRLGSGSSTAYAATILEDTYDLHFLGNSGRCLESSFETALPCNSGRIEQGLSLTADGVLNVDIPGIEIHGSVTVEGSPIQGAAADRGSLLFQLGEGGTAPTSAFGRSGPVSFRMALLPGTYQVWLNANGQLCEEPGPAPLPCIGGPLLSQVSLTSPGVLDVDMTRVHVRGSVTLDGAELPAESGDRGRLAFFLEEGGIGQTEPFGHSGPVSYDLTLLPGRYSVDLLANPELCTESPSSVPCVGGSIHTGLELSSSGVYDVDLQAATISGAVTLESAPLPSLAGSRGQIFFQGLDGGQYSHDLLRSGAGRYSVTLVPGDYVVAYNPDALLCTDDDVPPLPCAAYPLEGCEAP